MSEGSRKRPEICGLVKERPYTARARILVELEKHRGAIGKVAEVFGVERHTMSSYVDRLGLRESLEIIVKRLSRERAELRRRREAEVFRIRRDLRNATPEGRRAMYQRRLRQLEREKAARAAAKK